MPKVSILLPVHNGEKFLKEAVASVREQTFTDWELLVLDDHSTDRTPEVIRELQAQDKRILSGRNPENLGIQRTLNRGLASAKGEYVARIDDDDVWCRPEKLARQVEFLERNPEHVLLGTATVVIDEKGRELFRYLQPQTDREVREVILRRNCFTHSSVIFRRDAVAHLGGYSEDGKALHVEDYDLWLRLGKMGKMANLPLFGVKFRLRAGNISSRNKLDQLRKDLELTKKYEGLYPGGGKAKLYARARLAGYRLFTLLPASLRLKLLRKYKQI